MQQDKRFQIFVSSTYSDLRDERQKVIQSLFEIDCIPAGMEVFPAIDEPQLDFIKKIIDDCDYYLLIIGGRYGSCLDGISFTEKEYDYAIEKKIKVIALLHEDPGIIALNKSEPDAAAREKLLKFREKVSEGRLVRFWKRSEDLPSLVITSVMHAIKQFPAVGWVRADKTTSVEMLEELMKLREENAALKKARKRTVQPRKIHHLAGYEEEYKFTVISADRSGAITVKATWIEIFYFLCPHLLKSPDEEVVSRVLGRFGIERSPMQFPNGFVAYDDLMTIALQFKAHGWINTKVVSGKLHWILTEIGEKLMMSVRTVKTKK